MLASADTDFASLKPPAVLDLAAADGFLESVRSRALPGSRLRIDASEVEVLTLPCIQIILAALGSQAEITIVRPSDAFISAFNDLGLIWNEGAPAEEHQNAPVEPATKMDAIAMQKRIMKIDDSKTIRDMLKLTLAGAGFEVLQAVDGRDGVDMLDKEQVDVVITDINMPKMDGYEVIRHLRAKAAHKNTPILVLTTESETDKRKLARDAGATGWMVKPFDPEQLIATINKVAP
jgi:two-component system chemotaxis response regulator CheY